VVNFVLSQKEQARRNARKRGVLAVQQLSVALEAFGRPTLKQGTAADPTAQQHVSNSDAGRVQRNAPKHHDAWRSHGTGGASGGSRLHTGSSSSVALNLQAVGLKGTPYEKFKKAAQIVREVRLVLGS